MKQQLLLLEDIDGLGRSGDVVTAKPGFIRNFLVPQKKGVFADKHTLKMQVRLKEEREKRASVDRLEGQKLAALLVDVTVTAEVKVDQEGKMYGSVTQLDVARLLQQKGFQVERKHITLPQAVKRLGKHSIPLRLQEGVTANVTLEVIPEGGVMPVVAAIPAKTEKE